MSDKVVNQSLNGVVYNRKVQFVQHINDDGTIVSFSGGGGGSADYVRLTRPLSRYFGEKAGSTTASVFASQALTQGVYFKAPYSNTGNITVGNTGVTNDDGTTDTTAGWELAPGEASPFFPASNLNEFFLISDTATDDCLYAAF